MADDKQQHIIDAFGRLIPLPVTDELTHDLLRSALSFNDVGEVKPVEGKTLDLEKQETATPRPDVPLKPTVETKNPTLEDINKFLKELLGEKWNDELEDLNKTIEAATTAYKEYQGREEAGKRTKSPKEEFAKGIDISGQLAAALVASAKIAAVGANTVAANTISPPAPRMGAEGGSNDAAIIAALNGGFGRIYEATNAGFLNLNRIVAACCESLHQVLTEMPGKIAEALAAQQPAQMAASTAGVPVPEVGSASGTITLNVDATNLQDAEVEKYRQMVSSLESKEFTLTVKADVTGYTDKKKELTSIKRQITSLVAIPVADRTIDFKVNFGSTYDESGFIKVEEAVQRAIALKKESEAVINPEITGVIMLRLDTSQFNEADVQFFQKVASELENKTFTLTLNRDGTYDTDVVKTVRRQVFGLVPKGQEAAEKTFTFRMNVVNEYDPEVVRGILESMEEVQREGENMFKGTRGQPGFEVWFGGNASTVATEVEAIISSLRSLGTWAGSPIEFRLVLIEEDKFREKVAEIVQILQPLKPKTVNFKVKLEATGFEEPIVAAIKSMFDLPETKTSTLVLKTDTTDFSTAAAESVLNAPATVTTTAPAPVGAPGALAPVMQYIRLVRDEASKAKGWTEAEVDLPPVFQYIQLVTEKNPGTKGWTEADVSLSPLFQYIKLVRDEEGKAKPWTRDEISPPDIKQYIKLVRDEAGKAKPWARSEISPPDIKQYIKLVRDKSPAEAWKQEEIDFAPLIQKLTLIRDEATKAMPWTEADVHLPPLFQYIQLVTEKTPGTKGWTEADVALSPLFQQIKLVRDEENKATPWTRSDINPPDIRQYLKLVRDEAGKAKPWARSEINPPDIKQYLKLVRDKSPAEAWKQGEISAEPLNQYIQLVTAQTPGTMGWTEAEAGLPPLFQYIQLVTEKTPGTKGWTEADAGLSDLIQYIKLVRDEAGKATPWTRGEVNPPDIKQYIKLVRDEAGKAKPWTRAEISPPDIKQYIKLVRDKSPAEAWKQGDISAEPLNQYVRLVTEQTPGTAGWTEDTAGLAPVFQYIQLVTEKEPGTKGWTEADAGLSDLFQYIKLVRDESPAKAWAAGEVPHKPIVQKIKLVKDTENAATAWAASEVPHKPIIQKIKLARDTSSVAEAWKQSDLNALPLFQYVQLVTEKAPGTMGWTEDTAGLPPVFQYIQLVTEKTPGTKGWTEAELNLPILKQYIQLVRSDSPVGNVQEAGTTTLSPEVDLGKWNAAVAQIRAQAASLESKPIIIDATATLTMDTQGYENKKAELEAGTVNIPLAFMPAPVVATIDASSMEGAQAYADLLSQITTHITIDNASLDEAAQFAQLVGAAMQGAVNTNVVPTAAPAPAAPALPPGPPVVPNVNAAATIDLTQWNTAIAQMLADVASVSAPITSPASVDLGKWNAGVAQIRAQGASLANKPIVIDATATLTMDTQGYENKKAEIEAVPIMVTAALDPVSNNEVAVYRSLFQAPIPVHATVDSASMDEASAYASLFGNIPAHIVIDDASIDAAVDFGTLIQDAVPDPLILAANSVRFDPATAALVQSELANLFYLPTATLRVDALTIDAGSTALSNVSGGITIPGAIDVTAIQPLIQVVTDLIAALNLATPAFTSVGPSVTAAATAMNALSGAITAAITSAVPALTAAASNLGAVGPILQTAAAALTAAAGGMPPPGAPPAPAPAPAPGDPLKNCCDRIVRAVNGVQKAIMKCCKAMGKAPATPTPPAPPAPPGPPVPPVPAPAPAPGGAPRPGTPPREVEAQATYGVKDFLSDIQRKMKGLETALIGYDPLAKIFGGAIRNQVKFRQELDQQLFIQQGITMQQRGMQKNVEETLMNQKQLVQTGQDVSAMYTVQNKAMSRGITNARTLNRTMMTAGSLATMIGANVDEIADTLTTWHLQLGMNNTQMSQMSRSVQEVGRATGLTGENLYRAVKGTEQFLIGLRNAGTLSAETARNFMMIKANAQKLGIEGTADRMLKGLQSGTDLLYNMDDQMRNLMLVAASQGGGQGLVNDLLMGRGGSRNSLRGLASGIESLIRGIAGVGIDQIQTLSDEQRMQVDSVLHNAYGIRIGEVQRLRDTLQEAGRTFMGTVSNLDRAITGVATATDEMGRPLSDSAKAEQTRFLQLQRQQAVLAENLRIQTQLSEAITAARPEQTMDQILNSTMANLRQQSQAAGEDFGATLRTMGITANDNAGIVRQSLMNTFNQVRQQLVAAGRPEALGIKPEDMAGEIDRAMADRSGRAYRELMARINQAQQAAGVLGGATQTSPMAQLDQTVRELNATLMKFTNNALTRFIDGLGQGGLAAVAFGAASIGAIASLTRLSITMTRGFGAVGRMLGIGGGGAAAGGGAGGAGATAGTAVASQALLKAAGGLTAVVGLALGAIRGANEAESVGRSTAEGATLGALTGSATTGGGIMSSALGVEAGTAGDEIVGVVGSSLNAALIGAGIGTLIAPGIGTVIGGIIGALVGGIAELYKLATDASSVLGESIRGMWDKIQVGFDYMMAGINDALADIMVAMEGPLNDINEMVIKPVMQAINDLGQWVMQVDWKGVFSAIGDGFIVIGKVLGWVAKAIGKFISGAIGPIWSVLKPIFEGIIRMFKGLWNVLVGLWDVLSGIFTLDMGKIWKGIKEIFLGLGQIISGALEVIIVGLIEAVAGLPAYILGGIGKLFNWIGEQIGGAWGDLISSLGNIFGGLATMFEGVMGVIGGIFAWDWDRVSAGFGKIWEGFLGVLGGIWDSIVNLGKGLLEIDWLGILGSIVSGIGALLSAVFIDFPVWIWGLITGIDWLGMMSSVGSAILSGLTTIFVDIPVYLWNAFTGFFASVDWGQMFQDLLRNIGTGIGTLIGLVLDAIKLIVWDIPKFLIESIISFGEWIASFDWMAILGAIGDGLKAVFVDFPVWLFNICMDGLIGLGAWFLDLGNKAIEALGSFITWIANIDWGQVWSDFMGWIRALPGRIGSGLKSAWDGFWAFLGRVKDGFLSLGGRIVSSIGRVVGNFWAWLRDSFESLIRGIVDALPGWAKKLLGIRLSDDYGRNRHQNAREEERLREEAEANRVEAEAQAATERQVAAAAAQEAAAQAQAEAAVRLQRSADAMAIAARNGLDPASLERSLSAAAARLAPDRIANTQRSVFGQANTIGTRQAAYDAALTDRTRTAETARQALLTAQQNNTVTTDLVSNFDRAAQELAALRGAWTAVQQTAVNAPAQARENITNAVAALQQAQAQGQMNPEEQRRNMRMAVAALPEALGMRRDDRRAAETAADAIRRAYGPAWVPGLLTGSYTNRILGEQLTWEEQQTKLQQELVRLQRESNEAQNDPQRWAVIATRMAEVQAAMERVREQRNVSQSISNVMQAQPTRDSFAAAFTEAMGGLRLSLPEGQLSALQQALGQGLVQGSPGYQGTRDQQIAALQRDLAIANATGPDAARTFGYSDNAQQWAVRQQQARRRVQMIADEQAVLSMAPEVARVSAQGTTQERVGQAINVWRGARTPEQALQTDAAQEVLQLQSQQERQEYAERALVSLNTQMEAAVLAINRTTNASERLVQQQLLSRLASRAASIQAAKDQPTTAIQEASALLVRAERRPRMADALASQTNPEIQRALAVTAPQYVAYAASTFQTPGQAIDAFMSALQARRDDMSRVMQQPEATPLLGISRRSGEGDNELLQRITTQYDTQHNPLLTQAQALIRRMQAGEQVSANEQAQLPELLRRIYILRQARSVAVGRVNDVGGLSAALRPLTEEGTQPAEQAVMATRSGWSRFASRNVQDFMAIAQDQFSRASTLESGRQLTDTGILRDRRTLSERQAVVNPELAILRRRMEELASTRATWQDAEYREFFRGMTRMTQLMNTLAAPTDDAAEAMERLRRVTVLQTRLATETLNDTDRTNIQNELARLTPATGNFLQRLATMRQVGDTAAPSAELGYERAIAAVTQGTGRANILAAAQMNTDTRLREIFGIQDGATRAAAIRDYETGMQSQLQGLYTQQTRRRTELATMRAPGSGATADTVQALETQIATTDDLIGRLIGNVAQLRTGSDVMSNLGMVANFIRMRQRVDRVAGPFSEMEFNADDMRRFMGVMTPIAPRGEQQRMFGAQYFEQQLRPEEFRGNAIYDRLLQQQTRESRDRLYNETIGELEAALTTAAGRMRTDGTFANLADFQAYMTASRDMAAARVGRAQQTDPAAEIGARIAAANRLAIDAANADGERRDAILLDQRRLLDQILTALKGPQGAGSVAGTLAQVTGQARTLTPQEIVTNPIGRAIMNQTTQEDMALERQRQQTTLDERLRTLTTATMPTGMDDAGQRAWMLRQATDIRDNMRQQAILMAASSNWQALRTWRQSLTDASLPLTYDPAAMRPADTTLRGALMTGPGNTMNIPATALTQYAQEHARPASVEVQTQPLSAGALPDIRRLFGDNLETQEFMRYMVRPLGVEPDRPDSDQERWAQRSGAWGPLQNRWRARIAELQQAGQLQEAAAVADRLSTFQNYGRMLSNPAYSSSEMAGEDAVRQLTGTTGARGLTMLPGRYAQLPLTDTQRQLPVARAMTDARTTINARTDLDATGRQAALRTEILRQVEGPLANAEGLFAYHRQLVSQGRPGLPMPMLVEAVRQASIIQRMANEILPNDPVMRPINARFMGLTLPGGRPQGVMMEEATRGATDAAVRTAGLPQLGDLPALTGASLEGMSLRQRRAAFAPRVEPALGALETAQTRFAANPSTENRTALNQAMGVVSRLYRLMDMPANAMAEAAEAMADLNTTLLGMQATRNAGGTPADTVMQTYRQQVARLSTMQTVTPEQIAQTLIRTDAARLQGVPAGPATGAYVAATTAQQAQQVYTTQSQQLMMQLQTAANAGNLAQVQSISDQLAILYQTRQARVGRAQEATQQLIQWAAGTNVPAARSAEAAMAMNTLRQNTRGTMTIPEMVEAIPAPNIDESRLTPAYAAMTAVPTRRRRQAELERLQGLAGQAMTSPDPGALVTALRNVRIGQQAMQFAPVNRAAQDVEDFTDIANRQLIEQPNFTARVSAPALPLQLVGPDQEVGRAMTALGATRIQRFMNMGMMIPPGDYLQDTLASAVSMQPTQPEAQALYQRYFRTVMDNIDPKKMTWTEYRDALRQAFRLYQGYEAAVLRIQGNQVGQRTLQAEQRNLMTLFPGLQLPGARPRDEPIQLDAGIGAPPLPGAGIPPLMAGQPGNLQPNQRMPGLGIMDQRGQLIQQAGTGIPGEQLAPGVLRMPGAPMGQLIQPGTVLPGGGVVIGNDRIMMPGGRIVDFTGAPAAMPAPANMPAGAGFLGGPLGGAAAFLPGANNVMPGPGNVMMPGQMPGPVQPAGGLLQWLMNPFGGQQQQQGPMAPAFPGGPLVPIVPQQVLPQVPLGPGGLPIQQQQGAAPQVLPQGLALLAPGVVQPGQGAQQGFMGVAVPQQIAAFMQGNQPGAMVAQGGAIQAQQADRFPPAVQAVVNSLGSLNPLASFGLPSFGGAVTSGANWLSGLLTPTTTPISTPTATETVQNPFTQMGNEIKTSIDKATMPPIEKLAESINGLSEVMYMWANGGEAAVVYPVSTTAQPVLPSDNVDVVEGRVKTQQLTTKPAVVEVVVNNDEGNSEDRKHSELLAKLVETMDAVKELLKPTNGRRRQMAAGNTDPNDFFDPVLDPTYTTGKYSQSAGIEATDLFT